MNKLFAFLAAFAFALPAYAGWDNDEDGTGNACEMEQPNPTKQRRCW